MVGRFGGWQAGSGRAASDIAAPHPAHTRPPTAVASTQAAIARTAPAANLGVDPRKNTSQTAPCSADLWRPSTNNQSFMTVLALSCGSRGSTGEIPNGTGVERAGGVGVNLTSASRLRAAVSGNDVVMLYDLVGESVECSTADACVTHDEALDRAVRTGQIHDLRARSKRGGREKTGGTAARLRIRSRVGAPARPLRRARNRSPGSDDPRLRRWSYGDQPRHGPDCDPSPRCRDEPPVGSTRIHVSILSARLGDVGRAH